MARHVAIIELKTFHGFVISAQVAFLAEAGYDVHVIVTDQLVDIDLIRSLADKAEITVLKTSRWRRELLTLFGILIGRRYKFIVLNSVTRDLVMLSMLQPNPIRAVLHRLCTDYLPFAGQQPATGIKPVTHRLFRAFLSRSERLYLLSETLYEALKARQSPWDSKITFFATSYYPTVKTVHPCRDNQRVVFSILGQIDPRRRNYQSLMDAFEAIRTSPLYDQIEIRLLGGTRLRQGREFMAKATQFELVPHVIKNQDQPVIAFQDFADQLASSHFALLLIDREAHAGLQQRPGAVVAYAGSGLLCADGELKRPPGR
ncbi:MAG: hypothetical protein IPK19_22165 [Chloroflexi bacterium]|nr:hypothetical protein [Chloroflexota bacterium]